MLDKDKMADEIIKEMEAAGLAPNNDKAAGRKVWVAISQGVITHIQKSATVNVTGGSSTGLYKVT